MPFLNSGGSGGGAGSGNMTLLNSATATLAADGTFDFSGISQAYNDLYIKAILRGTAAAAAENVAIRLNNDSTAAYSRANVFVHNGTVTGASFGAAQTSGYICDCPAATGTAAQWTSAEISILGYTLTDRRKNILCTFMDNDGTTGEIGMFATIWQNNAAVTRIGSFGLTTANLLAGSQFRIYGVL